MNIKIISGGQTGVDRAALDVAIQLGMRCGGFCPKGRKSEDGPIPAKYPLRETHTDQYSERTEQNVLNSDGTIVLFLKEADKGTALTIDYCRIYQKPHLVLDLLQSPQWRETLTWMQENSIKILNVGGSRESSSPGIYKAAHGFLLSVFANSG